MRENLMPTKKKLEHWQVVTLMLMAYDFLAVIVSYFLALWIRFDCKFSEIELHYLHTYYRTIIIYALFCVVVFQFTKLYRSIWRFASYSELLRVLLATAVMGLVYISVTSLFVERMPISYYVFGLLIQFILTLGIRFSYRFVLLLRGRRKEEVHEKKVMVVGAGKAGQMLLRDIKGAKEINEKVVCFIDDNPNKWGRYIDNVPIFGGRERIMEAVKKFGAEKIYVAIPSARPEDKREILQICNETPCELMNLPGMYQLYTGEVLVSKMKPVQIEDLLGRDPIKTDMKEVFEYITGKVVLVTGVGSIGSELARQIAAHHPSHLILFDIYENNAYDIQLELIKKYPNILFIVDCVSGLLTDEFLTDEWGVDVAISASQKAFALPPGLGFMSVSQKALKYAEKANLRTFYFDIFDYVNNYKRNQTPFTPAVSLVNQLQKRLEKIRSEGLENFRARYREHTEYLRIGLEKLGFKCLAKNSANCVTAVMTNDFDASLIVKIMREKYNVEIAPSGGELKTKLFRIGNYGAVGLDEINHCLEVLEKVKEELHANKSLY